MKAEEIKKNDTVHLKKDIILNKADGFVTKLRKGTPLNLREKSFDQDTRKIKTVELHVNGSFVSIEIDADKVDEYIADFSENIDNMAS